MPVEKIPTCEPHASIPEYVVGEAQRQITYSSISFCITITGFDIGRLLGTHISPRATHDEVNEHFRILTTECGAHYPQWFIAGQFKNHFAHPKAVMKSLDDLRNMARAQLGNDAELFVFDTSQLTELMEWGFGLDLRVTLRGNKPHFSFAKAFGAKDQPFKELLHWYFNRL